MATEQMVKRHWISVDDPSRGQKCHMCRELIENPLQPNEYILQSQVYGLFAHLACAEYCRVRNIQYHYARVSRLDVIWWWRNWNYGAWING